MPEPGKPLAPDERVEQPENNMPNVGGRPAHIGPQPGDTRPRTPAPGPRLGHPPLKPRP